MTTEGRALAGAERSVFAAETWLRRDADPADWREAAARPGFEGEGAWRVASLSGGAPLHLHLGRRPDPRGAAERCAGGGVVVTPGFEWRPPQSGDGAATCLALSRSALSEIGAVALRSDADDRLRILSDDSARLWSGGTR